MHQMALNTCTGLTAERPSGGLVERASEFCRTTPYRQAPFNKRNWGGLLHSLCSYQGKLKPSIAHYLVEWFTDPGDRVLDPMSGVGTIPLEARRLGRVALGNDLSPLAEVVTRAKLEPFKANEIEQVVEDLRSAIERGPSLEKLELEEDLDFGLNGPVRDYFHRDTLREVVIARRFFAAEVATPARDVVLANLLHILHGNRPYALSRRSHPVTPFAPKGGYEYRELMERLNSRLDRSVPELLQLQEVTLEGAAWGVDCRDLELESPVDAVITSPPFTRSLRFWSTNWLRLWFAGWDRSDFETEPKRYVDVQQRGTMEPYREFAAAMHHQLRPNGLLVMHLGETAKDNMAETIRPELDPWFEIVFAGREDVGDTESHGLRDKGATLAHWYLFAIRR